MPAAPAGSVGGVKPLISTAFDSEDACKRFLDRKTPEELVAIFSETDPLRLVERCGRFVWDQGLFLDVDRVVKEAVYHIALRAARRPRDVSLDDWLRECLSQVVSNMLRKDLQMVRAIGDKEAEPWAQAHVFIREALGISDVRALCVCSSFNSMNRRERQAFFALCMDKRSVEECLEAGFEPPECLREASLRGLDHLLCLAPHPVLATCEDSGESEVDER